MDIYVNHLNAAVERQSQLGFDNVLGRHNDTRVGYNAFNMTQFFLRSGFDLRYQVKHLTVNSGLSYAYDVNGKNFRTWAYDADGVDALGAPTTAVGAWLQGSKLGRSVLSYNVGGEYALGKCFNVFGGYDGQAVLDRPGDKVQHVGYVGGIVKW
jgi:hypothetical protein